MFTLNFWTFNMSMSFCHINISVLWYISFKFSVVVIKTPPWLLSIVSLFRMNRYQFCLKFHHPTHLIHQLLSMFPPILKIICCITCSFLLFSSVSNVPLLLLNKLSKMKFTYVSSHFPNINISKFYQPVDMESFPYTER